jgi:hypothetical protein
MDWPEESLFSRTESFTQYQPTDDMVIYQSIENADLLQFGSEALHLIPSHICRKNRIYKKMDSSENNRLALSRTKVY